MSSRRKVLTVMGVLLALLIITPFAGSYVILLITHTLVFAILAMSLDILLGYTGLPSLGQAAYLGVGAYLTAILATQYDFGLGWSFWVVIVLGILSGAAMAALFGLFAIRATGVYFLMITLALGMCVWGLAYRWNSVTGGDNGINLPPRPAFGIDLANDVTYFYVVFGFFAVSLLLLYILVKSPFGRSLEGIRERELRMRILGYNTWLHKYIAFIIAGGFGGLAGVLWAHLNGLVSPNDVVLTTSVDALLMVVLGGGRDAGGRSHRRRRGHLPAGLSQHDSSVVAVCIGRGLCTDDSLSPGRFDGHSRANSPLARAVRKSGGSKETGIRISLKEVRPCYADS